VARSQRIGNRVAVAALAVLLPCACSSKTALHPARGKVLVDGKPAVGATIVFHPVEKASQGTLAPAGVVQSDGSFVLSTYAPGDGAPAGEYLVVITLASDAPPRDGKPPQVVKENKQEVLQAYTFLRTTPLRATIKEGPNEILPFKIKK
jgi:hypothetical protein